LKFTNRPILEERISLSFMAGSELPELNTTLNVRFSEAGTVECIELTLVF